MERTILRICVGMCLMSCQKLRHSKLLNINININIQKFSGMQFLIDPFYWLNKLEIKYRIWNTGLLSRSFEEKI